MHKFFKNLIIISIVLFLFPTIHYADNIISTSSYISFHPYDTDYFGRKKDEWAISKVEVNGDLDKKDKISLTFDSAYYNNYTYDILDILDRYDAKATFFMTCDFMEANPEHVKEIYKRGHEIGNHSLSHKDFTTLSNEDIVKEVMAGHNFIKNLLGIDMSLFRFPYGNSDERTVTALKKLGYYPIQWHFDTLDWKNESKEKICRRVDNNKDKLVEGSIVLMHNGAKYTVDALPHIFEILESKNLKCVKVSDLIYKHDFTLSWGKQSKK